MDINEIIDYQNWDNYDKEYKNEITKDFIYQKITRKPFRKQKIGENGKKDLLYSIDKKIKNNNPIEIVLFFGGYKHFWNDSSPKIDWAELFFIDHIVEWLKPIFSNYEPGIEFTFASEDNILEIMNGYTKEELDYYSNSFIDMLDNLKTYFPENFSIKYIRMGKDIYDSDIVKKEVLSLLDEKINDFKELDKEYQKKYLYRTNRNLKKINPSFDDEVKAKMIEDIFYEIEEKYSKDFITEDKIYITLTWGRSKEENIYDWLSIGSTRASIVDFWIGKGILEDNGKKYIKKIVSQNQYKNISSNIYNEKIENNIFKNNNFDKIEILKINK